MLFLCCGHPASASVPSAEESTSEEGTSILYIYIYNNADHFVGNQVVLRCMRPPLGR